MTSIFARAMGDDFARLHPMLQRRFGVGLEAGYGCIGRGVMDVVRVGAPWVTPFLRFGALRHILVPRPGRRIPFEIHNLPYLDPHGRETVTFVREFHYPNGVERFDATMVWGGATVIDYLGTHQHLATELDPRVSPTGGLVMTSGEQRFYAGPIGFRFPPGLTGRALVREEFDDDTGRFRISVGVHHATLGLLVGYRGSFECDVLDGAIADARLRPIHHEARS